MKNLDRRNLNKNHYFLYQGRIHLKFPIFILIETAGGYLSGL